MGTLYYAIDTVSKQIFELGKGNWSDLKENATYSIIDGYKYQIPKPKFNFDLFETVCKSHLPDWGESKVNLVIQKFESWSCQTEFYLTDDSDDTKFYLITENDYKVNASRYSDFDPSDFDYEKEP